jgi:transaldolase/glucose-6-phosphate isomerase
MNGENREHAFKLRRIVTIGGTMDRQRLSLGRYEARVRERLQSWQGERFASRLWRKDPTLWFPNEVPEIADRLGWLTLPEIMQEQVGELVALAQETNAERIRHVVLLGMGGSSLAPEVFQSTFGNRPSYPELIVLDSTHPSAVRATAQKVDARHTLFLVSSKSGTTL